ncbi:serine/threonine-protein kinase [Allorhodopirellula heiligendammensis]|uniref:Serine/threonine-protein kinase PrkC n=1 Tax=Allorhodopirellula heiligendammensis TaxID=2714739 RepID=A0A5C6BYX6_9BACT|nr:serine/threonine-protein kinase [Allorhodopirellula heiligendammensis]TWU17042.1 Serine/threonine-protein kinase PrkC [Allorhodopirellula heiligendammensis]
MTRQSLKHDHPDDEVLAASIHGDVDDVLESVLISHLDQCPACCDRLQHLAADPTSCERITQSLSRECLAARSTDFADHGTGNLADFAVTFLQPSDHPDAIGRLGDYEVLSVIGQGGMGIVLKGFQVELNRPVALKVMSPHLATLAIARQRFMREALATAAIVHPNVMPILSVSESSARLPFLVMPFVACHSLQQRLAADGPLPMEECLRIGVQVSAGLSAAHKQGLVHRDVKPANILLERGIERAMLTDFGLARAADDASVTRSGVIAGTPGYMSPEQARGEPIDARSDLFSLGSVLYAMASGVAPFRGETSYGILRKITDHSHRPLHMTAPSIPGWYETLVDRLLCKDAVDRFASANQVQSLLESCLVHVQQPGADLPPELKPRKRKRRLVIVCGFLLAVLCLPVIVWVAYSQLRYAPPPDAISDAERPVPSNPIWTAPVDPIDEDLRSLSDEIDALSQRVSSPSAEVPFSVPEVEGESR